VGPDHRCVVGEYGSVSPVPAREVSEQLRSLFLHLEFGQREHPFDDRTGPRALQRSFLAGQEQPSDHSAGVGVQRRVAALRDG